MTMAKHMLSTVDNPFNPFTQFKDWLSYDESKGYYSNALLARVVSYSDELSEADQDVAIESAINDIIKEDATLTYKKVSKESNL
jgi:hypothetical protein